MKKNNLDIDSVLNVTYIPDLISSKLKELSERVEEIDNQLNEDKSESLRKQYLLESEKLNLAKQKLSTPELEYQKYLKRKAGVGEIVRRYYRYSRKGRFNKISSKSYQLYRT